MKNKIFLAILLLTPILVVTFSSLYFALGYSPEGTKNNGVFFKSYFNFEQFNSVKNEKLIEFEDGKCVMLEKGDSLNIPAHTKHKVIQTSEQQPTIWLAVFYK